MVFMISEMLAPPFRWSISITWAVLLPPRMPAGFGAGAAFLPWGAFLAAGAFLADLLFTGAPLADCAPAFGLRVAFGFAGATSGLAASPKLWMRAQMRLGGALAGPLFFFWYVRRCHLRELAAICDARVLILFTDEALRPYLSHLVCDYTLSSSCSRPFLP